MTSVAFQKAFLKGISASPFKGTVTLIYGTDRYEVTDCVVKSGDNKAQAEEYGIKHVRTLDVQVPKTALPSMPSVAKHAIEYEGRTYALISVSGEDAASPVWVISATSAV
jgi:hypothetical protein